MAGSNISSESTTFKLFTVQSLQTPNYRQSKTISQCNYVLKDSYTKLSTSRHQYSKIINIHLSSNVKVSAFLTVRILNISHPSRRVSTTIHPKVFIFPSPPIPMFIHPEVSTSQCLHAFVYTSSTSQGPPFPMFNVVLFYRQHYCPFRIIVQHSPIKSTNLRSSRSFFPKFRRRPFLSLSFDSLHSVFLSLITLCLLLRRSLFC